MEATTWTILFLSGNLVVLLLTILLDYNYTDKDSLEFKWARGFLYVFLVISFFTGGGSLTAEKMEAEREKCAQQERAIKAEELAKKHALADEERDIEHSEEVRTLSAEVGRLDELLRPWIETASKQNPGMPVEEALKQLFAKLETYEKRTGYLEEKHRQRELSRSDVEKLGKHLFGCSHFKMHIIYPMSDSEAEQYAIQIEKNLKLMDWNVVAYAAPGLFQNGLILRVEDAPKVPKCGALLFSGLNSIGVDTIMEKKRGVEKNYTQLSVGHKP